MRGEKGDMYTRRGKEKGEAEEGRYRRNVLFPKYTAPQYYIRVAVIFAGEYEYLVKFPTTFTVVNIYCNKVALGSFFGSTTRHTHHTLARWQMKSLPFNQDQLIITDLLLDHLFC